MTRYSGPDCQPESGVICTFEAGDGEVYEVVDGGALNLDYLGQIFVFTMTGYRVATFTPEVGFPPGPRPAEVRIDVVRPDRAGPGRGQRERAGVVAVTCQRTRRRSRYWWYLCLVFLAAAAGILNVAFVATGMKTAAGVASLASLAMVAAMVVSVAVSPGRRRWLRKVLR